MKMYLTLILILSSFTVFSQDGQKNESNVQTSKYSYAYISIEGKLFSKKLNVEVDFGDTPEQIQTGKEYSKILTNKKSYAAILNYMAEREFELVNTIDYVITVQGTGGSTGIAFIMRKRN